MNAEKALPRIQDAEQRVREEVRNLTSLIAGDRVDETAVLAQADRITSAERELRRRQLRMLVSIKNKLTLRQEEALLSKHLAGYSE